MAKLVTANNINARKCVNTIVKSVLKNQRIHELNNNKLDYLARPESIIHLSSLKRNKDLYILKDNNLVGTVKDCRKSNKMSERKIYEDLIRDFAKEYTGSKTLKFKTTLEQPEFVTTFEGSAAKQRKRLMPELESSLGLLLPNELELYYPNSIKQLKDVFIKKNIKLPEKVKVNELLKKLSIIYVYPMCKQLTELQVPDIMHPFAKRTSIKNVWLAPQLVICGKHLGSYYYYSHDADFIATCLKANDEYDKCDARYLSFLKAIPRKTQIQSIQFDFGTFAKLLDNTEDYVIPDVLVF